MSIDARIANTYRDGPDLVLELIPSKSGAIAGAESLRVVNPRWNPPPPGTQLWGNEGTIMCGETPVYTRDGYTYLRENDDVPPPWEAA
ncbi:hypothetical protein LCGC14_1858810 [marine sediment metagenome]|uniref:Uncharacterized protein n=1 Tax=marine sediment metagenome TaxID=412755 RepID=A0A0F9J774_9ZZZZ